MPGYNFLGPFFWAAVSDGKKDLTLTPNGEDPNIPIADSLEVRITKGEIDVSVTLKPHTRELGFALMGDPSGVHDKYKSVSEFVKFGNILKVRFGYSSDPSHTSGSDPLPALITAPDVNIGTTIEFTINAEGANWFAKRDYDAHYFGGSDEKLPKAISPLDAIKEKCKKHGFEGPLFQSKNGPTNKIPDAITEMKKDKRSDIVQQKNVSDWEFIRRLCFDYGTNPHMMIKGGKYTLFIVSPLTVSGIPPIAKFVYGSQVYTGDGAIFPILGNITAPNTGMFLSRKGNFSIDKFFLSKKKEEDEFKPDAAKKGGTTVEGTVIGHGNSDKNVIDSKTGIKLASKNENKGGAGETPSSAREDKKRSEDKAQAQLLRDSGLTIEFDTVGVPFIVNTGEVIQVEIGKTWLNGNYELVEVTHRIDSGGYVMHVKAIAQGLVKSFLSDNMKGKSKFDDKIQEVKKGSGSVQKG